MSESPRLVPGGSLLRIVAVLAVLTMVLGTVVGVAQRNPKRMLAYSAIAHGGYLLVAIVAANEVGKAEARAACAYQVYLITESHRRRRAARHARAAPRA